ncbi:hypothetical protein [Cystobacter ferrugineus]|uniref:Uncharacterized protein n=1 Tax=Cystobacter ferrugineus TaxID=83449 RepID=A0A1L9BJZ7_9BACT|nr:hypothetical protein [Cystobacter ferrugineus]OJH42563.1 hypothetical protein BON30_05075 [Cystobacter ferrugineus]
MPASDERRLQALVLAPVRRVQRRLHTARFAEAGVVPVWAAATACVVGRLVLRDAAPWVLPVPLLASGVWWFLRARARRVSLAHAAVLADRSAGAGGLLLTRLERPVGEWELAANQYARAVTPPAVAWRRPAGALLAALVFLAVGLLLPLPARAVRPANAAAAAKVDAVRAKAEALVHEEPPGSAVDEELRRLAEEVAEGRFDSADWEAADRLEQSLDARAARAAAELAAASEAARELEDALDAASGAEAATREREALESALMTLGSGAGESGGAPRTGEAGGAGSLGAQTPRSRAEVADLRSTLDRRQRELEQRFGEELGRKGSRPGQGQGEGDGQGEGESRPGGHASRGAGKGKGSSAGGGKESRPLMFGEKAEMEPERLAFKPLPKGQGGEAGDLWGLKAVEPGRREAGPGGGAQGAGARGDAEAGHSAGPLLPRNRELVKRYFGEQP